MWFLSQGLCTGTVNCNRQLGLFTGTGNRLLGPVSAEIQSTRKTKAKLKEPGLLVLTLNLALLVNSYQRVLR